MFLPLNCYNTPPLLLFPQMLQNVLIFQSNQRWMLTCNTDPQAVAPSDSKIHLWVISRWPASFKSLLDFQTRVLIWQLMRVIVTILIILPLAWMLYLSGKQMIWNTNQQALWSMLSKADNKWNQNQHKHLQTHHLLLGVNYSPSM